MTKIKYAIFYGSYYKGWGNYDDKETLRSGWSDTRRCMSATQFNTKTSHKPHFHRPITDKSQQIGLFPKRIVTADKKWVT